MSDSIDLLTADELANRLHVKPDTVRVWARRGLIPRVQLSPKVIRFELPAAVSALKQRQTARRVQQEGGGRD